MMWTKIRCWNVMLPRYQDLNDFVLCQTVSDNHFLLCVGQEGRMDKPKMQLFAQGWSREGRKPGESINLFTLRGILYRTY